MGRKGQVSSEKVESLIRWRKDYSGNASRTKGKFTFYVLIPFMMIFSCVEYPILGTWRLVVDCLSRLSEPFVISLGITLLYRFLDDSSLRSVETIDVNY